MISGGRFDFTELHQLPSGYPKRTWNLLPSQRENMEKCTGRGEKSEGADPERWESRIGTG